jgi:ferritin-like metal-binding protein YciE
MKGPNMQITSFKDLYITELQELTSFEGQLVDALERMAKAASHPPLKKALKRHREQTQSQKQRLETILNKHGASPNYARAVSFE